jgi:hypothetical protein
MSALPAGRPRGDPARSFRKTLTVAAPCHLARCADAHPKPLRLADEAGDGRAVNLEQVCNFSGGFAPRRDGLEPLKGTEQHPVHLPGNTK